MDDKEIRLRIYEALVAQAARAEIQQTEQLIKRCKLIETYVMGPRRADKPGKS